MRNCIIPIFIPHFGCKQECIFCNQHRITSRETPVTAKQVEEIIQLYSSKSKQSEKIEVAYYGGSFTALPLPVQQQLLAPAKLALDSGNIHDIRISTRPDCINTEILENLLANGVSTVELGVQSMDDRVLEASARGHSSLHVVFAVDRIKTAGIQCGIQLMPGLPCEDFVSLITTVQKVVQLKPDFVRIYPTIVIAGTRLAQMYANGQYTPFSLSQAIKRVAYLKLAFARCEIPVIRTGLQATEELNTTAVVDGPYHPAFGELVDMHIFFLMISHCLDKIGHFEKDAYVSIHHHNREASKVRGHKNGHREQWKKQNPNIKDIFFIQDGKKMGEVVVEYSGLSFVINKNLLIHV